MRYRRLIASAFVACSFAGLASGAAANAVLFWNEQALNAIRLARTPPPIAAHHLAATHAAIFDSVNGITRTNKPWLVAEAAPSGANMDAAIATAGYTVINGLWGQAANPQVYRSAYESALAAIPDGQAKSDGVAFGKKVAESVLAARGKSGWNKPVEGVFSSTEPGLWRETPPGFRPPVLPHWRSVAPYVMKSPDQFRAPPPPALDSKQAADEMEQIFRIGSRDNSERTEYETLAAPFWADDLGSATPPGHWNVIAQDLARRRNLSTEESARLFALLNLACADAGISCWDTKFHYSTWRPETALRDENIEKINTHAVRTFKKLSDARNEIGMSRLWAGIHVMADNLEGQKVGIKIADYVFDNALLPVAR